MLQYLELGVARCKCKLVLKILDLHIEWTCNRKNNHKMNCWFWKECLIIVNLSLGSGLRTSFGIYRIWPKNTRKIRHEYSTLASWINHDQELFPWSFLTSIRYMGDFGLHVEAGLVRSYCVGMDLKELFELGMSANPCWMRIRSIWIEIFSPFFEIFLWILQYVCPTATSITPWPKR